MNLLLAVQWPMSSNAKAIVHEVPSLQALPAALSVAVLRGSPATASVGSATPNPTHNETRPLSLCHPRLWEKVPPQREATA